jgi:hypothetical protein
MTTMSRPHRNLSLPLVGLLTVAVLLGGCRGERYEKVRAQRDQSLRDTLDWWHAYNARSEGNLERFSAYAETYRERRRVQLAKTRDNFRESRERREDKWHREADARRAWWSKQIKGNPENIEPAMSKILY